VPLEKGASAKCLLAHMPAAALSAALPPDRQGPELLAELAEIRKAGFAVSDSEVDAGVWGVSVPLFALGKQAVGALTLMAPSVRVQGKHPPLIQMAVVTAARISRSLSR
jgi:DNA-binding IclR family transcriptional regulator